jgi:hypothetical protein
VLVLDQGFLQDLWSILIAGKSRTAETRELADLLTLLYYDIDTKVVVIEVDPSTAATRVAGRTHGDSRFDGLPQDELRGALDAAGAVKDQVKDAAMMAGLPMNVLNGTIPVNELVSQLRALLPTPLNCQKERLNKQ